jgi:hypothetical protein
MPSDLGHVERKRESNPRLSITSRMFGVGTGTAPDGSGLITLDASSVQTAPDGSRPIVWMIIGMIKAHPTENREQPRLGDPPIAPSGLRRAPWTLGDPVTRLDRHTPPRNGLARLSPCRLMVVRAVGSSGWLRMTQPTGFVQPRESPMPVGQEGS